MEENSRRYIYYKLKEATTKKFYESIGIDYEDNGANPMLPENVDFGLELEEIGVKWGVCEVHDFDSTSDITLRDYDRMTMKYLDTETGEYQTSLLSTDYPDDFRKLDDQLDILNYYGAKTNESCGLHIHVSTRYTGEYELDTGDAEIPPEDFDKAKNLQREVYEMQHVIGKAFKMFDDRRKETCSYLSTPEYDDLQLEKFQFVNMETLDDGTGIEFRFLNLPFALDKKVIDAYVDFVTSYMLYIDEGNNTMEYVEEAI
ncbi:MAG: amidoligase family protein, partial [Clostridia bacterium]|nr:amidoligase family protein [Clostridia bacterium]